MKKKRSLVITLLAILVIIGFHAKRAFSQTAEIDSLTRLLAIQPDGNEKADNLIKLARIYYLQGNEDSALAISTRAEVLSNSLGHLTAAADGLYLQSLVWDRLSDYRKAEELVVRSIAVSQSLNDSFRLAKGYNQYASIIMIISNCDSALPFQRKSLNLFIGLRDTFGMVSSYNSFGNSYLTKCVYDSAAYYYLKAMQLCEKAGLEKYLGQICNNLGKSFMENEHYAEAEKYLNMALENNTKYGKTWEIALNYQNLGILADYRDEPEKALEYYFKAEELWTPLGNAHGIANNRNNIAGIYLTQEKYDLALESYDKALQYFREQNLPEGIILGLKNKAVIYSRRGNYELAARLNDSSLRLATEMGYQNLRRDTYLNMSMNYYRAGDYKKAFDTKEKYYALADSLINLEKTKMIANLTLKYERERDQAQILALEKDNLVKDLSLKKRTIQRNIYLFAGMGIILLALFLLFYFRQKAARQRIISENRIRQLEEEKKMLAAKALVEGQEEERKRIATELHDGLGVLLSTTKMQFTTIRDTSPENRPLIDKATQLLEQASGDVRRISHNMMPGLLTKLGLFEALQDLFEKVEESDVVKVDVEIPEDSPRLPENQEIMLYRIIQEMVNNTLKHARAKSIKFKMRFEQGRLEITYGDDGVGFDPEEKLGGKSIGLNSIQSRVNFLQGTLEINSRPGDGTRFRVLVPA